MNEGGLCKHQLLRQELCRGGRGSERGFGTSMSGGGGKKEKKVMTHGLPPPAKKRRMGATHTKAHARI